MNYLCKKERPFRPFSELLVLEENNGMKGSKSYRNDRVPFNDVIGKSMKDSFVEDLCSPNFHSILTNDSTDSSMLNKTLSMPYTSRM